MSDLRLHVSKRYGEKTVFDGLEMEITEGEISCVLGPSGVGKTTLLNMLAGLTEYEGEIAGEYDGVGYIFQEPRLLPYLSVEENLLYAGAKKEELDGVLEMIGLAAYKDKRPRSLSGGEKQRVSFARAFLSGAELILLDEPFSSLDIALKMKLYEVFASLWQEKKRTAVMVTHDIEEALALADRVVVIKGGGIVCDLRLERGERPTAYGSFAKERETLIKALTED
ncbi:MAG: ABC transporter ATP-binding protein [Clostridia bacterium]|nr:ABC transporter ATP-binding protein [Clostridia bacterium]